MKIRYSILTIIASFISSSTIFGVKTAPVLAANPETAKPGEYVFKKHTYVDLDSLYPYTQEWTLYFKPKPSVLSSCFGSSETLLRPIGTCLFSYKPYDHSYIANLNIDHTYRRSGLGSLMMTNVINEIRAHNVKEITLSPVPMDEGKVSRENIIQFYRLHHFAFQNNQTHMMTLSLC